MSTNQYAKTIIIGNLGKDIKFFPEAEGKQAMVSGSVCVNSDWAQRDQQGNILKDPQTGKTVLNSVATWYSFTLRGRRAAAFAQYMTKGKPVLLEGEMREREYNSNLAPYPCYDVNGQPVLDQNGNHYHAYIQVARKELYLRVTDWGFIGSKNDGSTTAYPQQQPAPQFNAQAGPTATPVMTPQNVQHAFTSQGQVQPQFPVFNVHPHEAAFPSGV
jgi:hypothetical protein